MIVYHCKRTILPGRTARRTLSKSAMKTTRIKQEPGTLPDVDAALTELARRQARAAVSLILRLVGVGILIAVLVTQIPALARNRWLLDATGFGLILWPFFTEQGKLFAWRIALGRGYVRAKRWQDAERTLAPLAHRYGQFFDAGGAGRQALAEAQTAQQEVEKGE